MASDYLETRFRTELPIDDWPIEFVIISANATTGNTWTSDRNAAADDALRARLEARGGWLERVTGYSPSTGHTEPSWATVMTFDEACDLGIRFQQDAIYLVRNNELFVSYCDARRALVPVEHFTARLDPPTPSPAP